MIHRNSTEIEKTNFEYAVAECQKEIILVSSISFKHAVQLSYLQQGENETASSGSKSKDASFVWYQTFQK